MGNKTPTKTTLKPGDNLPARGKSKKTLILDMLKARSMLSLKKTSTTDEAEQAFFHHVAESAFNLEDGNRGMCLKLLADKGWASVKPSSELVEFEFDANDAPHVQAARVMSAAAMGRIPPDIASMFIQSIKNMIDIEEFTSLKDRIVKLEEALNEGT
tara:strand:+ start:362 stop:832 length:471 start_codon:yes stop_codon:yes gene_type:complete